MLGGGLRDSVAVCRLIPCARLEDDSTALAVYKVGNVGILGILRKNRDDRVVVVIKTDAEIIGLVKIYGNSACACVKGGLEILHGRNNTVRRKVGSDLNVNSYLLTRKGEGTVSTVHIRADSSVAYTAKHGVVVYGERCGFASLVNGNLISEVTVYLCGKLGEDLKEALANEANVLGNFKIGFSVYANVVGIGSVIRLNEGQIIVVE